MLLCFACLGKVLAGFWNNAVSNNTMNAMKLWNVHMIIWTHIYYITPTFYKSGRVGQKSYGRILSTNGWVVVTATKGLFTAVKFRRKLVGKPAVRQCRKEGASSCKASTSIADRLPQGWEEESRQRHVRRTGCQGPRGHQRHGQLR